MATPRATSITILPASVRPSQRRGLLAPVEPQSPSPMSRNPSGLARKCSTTNRLGVESRPPLPLQNPSHSFTTTASGARMYFFRFLGPLLIWPNLIPLSPCKTPRSTGANSPPLDPFAPFHPPPAAAASPAWHFTCILLFFPPFRYSPVSSEEETSWHLTSLPLIVFSSPPRRLLR